MYLFKINKQRFLIITFMSLFIGLLLGLMAGNIPFAHFIQALENSAYYSNDPLTTIALVLFIIPYVLFITALTGFFKQDFNIQVVYCFTRRKNLFAWYLKKCMALLFQSILSLVIFFGICIIMIFLIADFPKSTVSASFGIMFQIFLLAWMFVFSFAFLINSLSFYASTKWILPATVTYFITNAFLLPLFIEKQSFLSFLNPLAHINLTLHEQTHFLFEDFAYMIPGLKVWHSILFFFMIIIIAFISGYLKIKKSDLGLMLED